MRIKLVPIAFLISLLGVQTVKAYLPEKGVLPNETTATKVAEIILIGVYGERVVEQRPFVAKLSGGLWIIDGTFHCPKGNVCKGGTAHIEISKSDGRVKDISHGK